MADQQSGNNESPAAVDTIASTSVLTAPRIPTPYTIEMDHDRTVSLELFFNQFRYKPENELHRLGELGINNGLNPASDA